MCCKLFFDAINCSIEWCAWTIISIEVDRIVDEALVAYLKVLYQQSPEGIVVSHKETC